MVASQEGRRWRIGSRWIGPFARASRMADRLFDGGEEQTRTRLVMSLYLLANNPLTGSQ